MGSKISEIKNNENPKSKMNPTGEQVFFNNEWNRLSKKGTLKATTLKTCRYPNGKWYDSGRGGSGAGYRAKCRTTDTSNAGGDVEGTGLVVIQNNWMVGNERKMLRAKRWNHWFLNDDGNTCSSTVVLASAIASTVKGVPPNGVATRAEGE